MRFIRAGDAACVAKVFHQEASRWHEIDERWHFAADAVPVGERDVDTDAAREREMVDDRIG